MLTIPNSLKRIKSTNINLDCIKIHHILIFGALLSFVLNNGIAISGDEEFYLSRSSFFVKNIFKVINGELNFALLVDNIVDRGFFVPGVSIILLPVSFIFAGSPPLYMIRAYAILINILLVFFIYRELVKLGLKQTKAKLAVIIPFLIPYYLYYSGAIWGDLIASHAAILLFLFFERRLRDEDKKWYIYICIGAGFGFIS